MSERMEKLLMHTLGLPNEEREQFMEAVNAEDPSMGDRLHQQIAHLAKVWARDVEEKEKPALPTRIGEYQVLERIGQGGMGVVYLALQPETERKVAVKVIRGSLISPAFIERFRYEYKILARMNHQHIARIYQAGLTPQGDPYFAMEYVAGTTITKYCAEKDLDLAGRLALFRQVCEGVRHAHQRAVVHGDLKPANIVVVEQDGAAQVKIIDFGIARDRGGPEKDQAPAMGTPAYMSPERLMTAGDGGDIRSDVYALGVVFYEMLTGLHPLDSESFLGMTREQALDRCRHAPRPKPSTRLTKHGTSLPWQRELSRDLDWIVMKAIAEDADARYGGVSELMADLTAYQQGRPVSARPASWSYRTGKYMRRHRVQVALSVLFLTTIVWAFTTITLKNREMQTELARRATLLEFMLTIFTVADTHKLGVNATIIEGLEVAGGELPKEILTQLEIADIKAALGRIYFSIGRYKRSVAFLTEAIAIYTHELGPEHEDTLKAMMNLARALRRLERFAESEELCREIIEICERTRSTDHPTTCNARFLLGLTLYEAGEREGLTEFFSEILEHQLENLPHRDPRIFKTKVALGNSFHHEGKLVEAERLYREALIGQKKYLDEDHPETLATKCNLANCLLDRGGKENYEEAERILHATYKIRYQKLGASHSLTDQAAYLLARALADQQKWAEAEPLAFKVVAYRIQHDDKTSTQQAIILLASIWNGGGHQSEAIDLLYDLFEFEDRNLVRGQILRAVNNLGDYLRKKRRHDEAANILEPLLQWRLEHEPNTEGTLITMITLAELRRDQLRLQEKCRLLENATELADERHSQWLQYIKKLELQVQTKETK